MHEIFESARCKGLQILFVSKNAAKCVFTCKDRCGYGRERATFGNFSMKKHVSSFWRSVLLGIDADRKIKSYISKASTRSTRSRFWNFRPRPNWVLKCRRRWNMVAGRVEKGPTSRGPFSAVSTPICKTKTVWRANSARSTRCCTWFFSKNFRENSESAKLPAGPVEKNAANPDLDMATFGRPSARLPQCSSSPLQARRTSIR